MKKKLLTPIIAIVIFVLLGGSIGFATIYLGGSGRTDEINLQKGLVGHWTFDGNAKDSTPYGNNGTIYEASSTADRKGKANGALSFDGLNDYVVTPYTPSSFTISVWVKPNSSADSQRLWSMGPVLAELLIWDSKYDLYGGGYDIYPATAPVTIGKWDHIVAIVTQDVRADLYFNGVLVGSDTSVSASNLNPLEFGKRQGQSDSYLNGTLDEVRIYNRALSAEEIKALYESYDPAPRISDLQKGLVGYWTLDGNAKDSTPYGNNGIIYEASSTADRKGKANGALSFDGTNDYVSVPTTLPALTTITQTAWVKFNVLARGGDNSGRQVVIRAGNFDADDIMIYQSQSNNDIRATAYNGSDWSDIIVGGISVSTWYFVVNTVESTGSQVIHNVYLNGILTNSNTTAGTVETNAGARIGGSNYPLNGSIDEVHIYNRALSAEEIKALYESYDPAPRISDLQKGLVGYWTLDGHAKDSTPYNNHGIIYEASSTADRKGKANGALSFDGSNDYVQINHNSSIDVGSGSFTYGLWVYALSSLGSWDTPIYKGGDWVGAPGYDMELGLNWWNANIADGSVTAYASFSDTSLNNQWVYLVAVIDRTAQKLYTYTNGIPINSADISTVGSIDSSAYNLLLGKQPDCPFNGKIDEVHIYNRALSADEIKQLYESYQ